MTKTNIQTGHNIRQFRSRLGLSQEKLASYLNVTPAAISQYETGERNIPLEIIERSAELFGIESYDLLEENADINNTNYAFAFRATDLTENELNHIANFRTVVRNYINMKNVIANEKQNNQ